MLPVMMNLRPSFAIIALVAFLLSAQRTPSGQRTDSTPVPTTTGQSLRLTFQDALIRARNNGTQFRAAVTSLEVAVEARKQAQAVLLPELGYNNSAIYTQSTGLANQIRNNSIPPVIFIANNAVHEYISQGNVHEVIDLAAAENLRSLSAAVAVARAQETVASRGLLVAVAQLYYSAEAATEKLEVAKKAADEGESILRLTQALEAGGEVAHSDVIKAEIQVLDRKRQLEEARLAVLKSHLALAVLILPDVNSNFELVDDLHGVQPLPTLAEIQQQVAPDSPEVRAARAALDEARYHVFGARAGYLPSLTLDYFYGIDATHFAVNSVFGNQKFSNIGSSASASLTIPIWNWGGTQSRVKQAEMRRLQAKRELSLAERQLLADIQARYAEADTALQELKGLSRSADESADSLRLATLRYKNGEAKILEVVDAQTEFFSAHVAYQDGAVRYHVARAALRSVAGVPTIP